ncbi:transposase [Spiractinospora alimapuensis]|uniref:transposase n=1 Tax=Spiractinospora alimapuensis TaxID=2820884 RepID=UPI0022AAEE6A|nr:transposase [Spiractinospora alimapuensis]
MCGSTTRDHRPLLPTNQGRGGRWRDHRTMLDGMIDKLAPGCPWRDLPERYGPWQSVYGRYRRWSNDGTIEAILRHVQVRHDAVGRIQWEVGIDSTGVRAHQHAAGAPKKGPNTEQSRTKHSVAFEVD